MLGWFWSGCIVLSFLMCLVQQWLHPGSDIFARVVQSLFNTANLSVDVAIGLIGLMALWLGLFRIAQQAGVVTWLSRLLIPLFRKLMPEIPANHTAHGSITMNLAANALGLDNAATPLGIKAMQDLQAINQHKQTLSNAQILFLVLNTSSVTVLPVTVFLYRAQQGATYPTEVFVPILFATSISTLTGLLCVGWAQRLPLLDRTVLLYLLAFASVPLGLYFFFSSLPHTQVTYYAQSLANMVLFGTVVLFIVAGWIKKVNVYDEFITGAKQGFGTAIKLIPYLIAMLIAIGLLRASGLLDLLLNGIRTACVHMQIDTGFVDALPTAIMKPFSGSGARAAMIEVMQNNGADSFAAKVAGVMQGSTETTFYVLAVYCGAVGISKIRYAMTCGLAADAAGITAAIFTSYVFFQ